MSLWFYLKNKNLSFFFYLSFEYYKFSYLSFEKLLFSSLYLEFLYFRVDVTPSKFKTLQLYPYKMHSIFLTIVLPYDSLLHIVNPYHQHYLLPLWFLNTQNLSKSTKMHDLRFWLCLLFIFHSMNWRKKMVTLLSTTKGEVIDNMKSK